MNVRKKMYQQKKLHSGLINIVRGSQRYKKMALTFDVHYGKNAPYDEKVAVDILNVLKNRNVKCTFFLTGKFIETCPEMVRKIVENGHEVGNHTYSHPHVYLISKSKFIQEILRTEMAFYKVTDRHISLYWRAPYGEYTERLGEIASEIGYTHIHWTHYKTREESLDSLDWVSDQNLKIYYSASEITEHILTSKYKNGGIVLFHMCTRKIAPVYHRLNEIIERLISQRYRLTIISEIINDMTTNRERYLQCQESSTIRVGPK